jgi:putative membrane protein
MELRASDRVPELTALLSVVSLAAVFGAVGGVVPASLLPQAPEAVVDAIPHINAVLSTTALVTIPLAVRAVRRGRIGRHRALMVTTLGLFAAFLVCYLYRLTLRGTTAFPGPDAVYQYIYLPTLGVHILLAIVCIPLLYYVALLALTRPIAAIRDSLHPRVGRVAASLWFVSFLLGDVVYLLLYVVY